MIYVFAYVEDKDTDVFAQIKFKLNDGLNLKKRLTYQKYIDLMLSTLQ
jgi:hypothetical protein